MSWPAKDGGGLLITDEDLAGKKVRNAAAER